MRQPKEDRDSIDKAQEKKGWIDWIIKGVNTWVGLILTLVAFGGLIVYLLVCLDQFVEGKIQKRLEPFELYAYALSLNHQEQYDDAIPLFEKSFDIFIERNKGATNSFEDKKLYENQGITVAYDYMFAINNSNIPNKYHDKYDRIKEFLDKERPNTVFADNEFGWYNLRTGNLAEAEKNFQAAVSIYDASATKETKAKSFWGLTLTYLAKGDVKKAVENTKNAAAIHPAEYALPVMIASAESIKKDKWHREIATVHPAFDASIEEYFKELKTELGKQK
ncbi:MAG TPA: hypothetical protein VGO50_12945 [Pyrinomonadaceae bacterium]|jgi:tetratricopeptide (TPR) repeat protein|nr:hypothetical protein [Pyrinomonadaceae bacterium]